MTFNFCIKDNISSLWNIEDEKNFDLKTNLLYDYPKDLYKESIDNIIPTYKAEGNNYHNNQTIYDIPEFLIEKKTTSNLTKRNTSSLYFSYENIINVLKESNDGNFNTYIQKLENCKNDPELKEIEYEMKILKKERKKYGENVGIKKNNPKLKLGRKKAIDQPERKHNKKSADNIIKKVKGYLLEFLITFVNGIINKKEYTLKPLDYKSNIDKMKKDEDIKLLDKTVKDYLYQDISRKYFKTPINWNKQIINHLLKDQKDNEVINFVLNMKIKDWIELFTLKKNIYAFENLSINGYEEIQNKMQKIPSIKDIFNKILEKYKDDLYFTKFVFYLYNYEKWFRSKIGRNREKREKQILILI